MRRPIVLAALTALAVRVLIIAKLPAPPVWQGSVQLRLAAHLAAGHGLAHAGSTAPPWQPTAFQPAGYPALVALVARAGISPVVAAYVVNVLAGVAAAACAAVLGARIAGRRGGYLAGLACALVPGAALWTAAAMPETLAGALLVGALATATGTATAHLRPRIVRAALAGVLVGGAALALPQWLFAAPFVGALAPGKRLTRAAAGATCVLGALLVVLPWTARNCVALDGCALVATDGGAVLLAGTLPAGHAPDALVAVAQRCDAVHGEVARDGCLASVARARIAQDPVAWLRLGAARLLNTFAFEWSPVNYVRAGVPGAFVEGASAPGTLVCSLAWWAVAAGAIVGGRRAVRVGGVPRAIAHATTLAAVLVALRAFALVGADSDHLVLVPLLTSLAAGVLLPPQPPPEPELAWVS